jgi:CheY-like chemotaxis protein
MPRIKEILNDLIDLIFRMFSVVLETDNVAIRLKDEKGGFPLYRWIGYEKDLVDKIRREDHAGRDELCLCCLLMKQKLDFIEKYCRASGAFISNDLTADLARIRAEYAGVVRECECEQARFQSLGLLPFSSESSTVAGLFHVAAARKGMFTEDNTRRIEEIAQYFSQMAVKIERLATPNGAKFRVLVAEDDEAIGMLIKKILSRFGYECVHCMNGLEALEYLSKNRIHLLITDLMMPGMDGMDLIREIRTRYDIYGPRIMVLSARPDLLNETFISERRISAVLAKPLENIFLLPEAVEKVCCEEIA